MITQPEVVQLSSLAPPSIPSSTENQTWTTHATALMLLDDRWANNKPRLRHAKNIELSPWVTYTGWYQEIHGQKIPHGNGTRVTVLPSIDSPSLNWNTLFAEVRKTLSRIFTDTTEEGIFQNGELISWEKNMKWLRNMIWAFGELGLLKDGAIVYENGITCKVQNMLISREQIQVHRW